MEYGEVVAVGIYFESRADGSHDIMDVAGEEMREFEEHSGCFMPMR